MRFERKKSACKNAKDECVGWSNGLIFIGEERRQGFECFGS